VAKVKKFNLAGQEIGQVDLGDLFVMSDANRQMIKDYIVAIRANARQWSANTKGRSEVKHTTKKPHPQKGGGRARQGSLVAPQYKGGGRVFGPKPKFDQHVRINKKERRAAIRFLLSEKIRNSKLSVIDNLEMEAPKTKVVADFLEASKVSGRVLFLGEGSFTKIETEAGESRVSIRSDKHTFFAKSVRNLPKVEFLLASNINGYDLMIAKEIVITEAALNELNELLTM
jgi:large subunit ribosomal protein L4